MLVLGGFIATMLPASASAGKTRTYDIEAKECEWNYAPWYPVLNNPIFGTSLNSLGEDTFLADEMIGQVYTKAVY